MFRSATFKLTMWYLAIVMAISLIFSVVVYDIATGELDRGLNSETRRIYQQFPVFQDSQTLKPGADYDRGAHRIFLRLVLVNAAVLISAGAASYWLARRTLRPIEEAHEQQKRFTADVSHELRTPLTALKMETEVALLNTKNGKLELRQVLKSNLEEADKLEHLINNLLRLTRLEADELQQQFNATSGQAIIDAAVNQTAKLAAKHQVNVKVGKLARNQVNGDQDSLVQLIVILLDNAIKYSPSKKTVEISSRAINNQVVFKIVDRGEGIPPSTLEHVFERFYRGEDDSRNKTAASGFGLGLSIAKMIADLHGGVISIESGAKQGTTACVSLPARHQPK